MMKLKHNKNIISKILPLEIHILNLKVKNLIHKRMYTDYKI